MSNSTVISNVHYHRFGLAAPENLLDVSPMKNQGRVLFFWPRNGIPSHHTHWHSHQLRCTQIRVPRTETSVNNVPRLISNSDGVFTPKLRPSQINWSEGAYGWIIFISEAHTLKDLLVAFPGENSVLMFFLSRKSDPATWPPLRASTTELDSFSSSPYKRTS